MIRVVRVLVSVIVIAGGAWVLRGMRLDQLAATVRSARWPLVAAAAFANLTLNTTARAMRWRSFLPPSPRTGRRVSIGAIAVIVLMAQLANNVLPLRLGEALRTLTLHEQQGHPLRTVIASQVLEKAVEITSMSGFAVPAAIFAHRTPRLGIIAFGIFIAALTTLFLLTRLARGPHPSPTRTSPIIRMVRTVQDAARTVDRPGALWRGLAWSLTSDAIDVCLIGMCCAALGVYVPVPAWCAVLVAVNLATVIPSTPAQLGMIEAGGLVVLLELGVPREQALAATLVYHAVHAVPTSLAGTIGWAVTALGRRKAAE